MVSDLTQPQSNRMRRVAVVGNAGAGKTTVAQRLAARLACPHIELDALYWGPHWEPRPVEVFRQMVTEALASDGWVADGNYSSVRDLVWARADTLLWLDPPLTVVLWRLWWRTLRRLVTHQALWNENRETWHDQFLSRESLFLYTIKTHASRRQSMEQALAQPEYTHLRVVHLKSARAVESWLRTVAAEYQASASRVAEDQ